ncbi:hypothetical protein [Propionibacterium freudenreichii]|uniref:hypothetical protein n=1 Tax=Propionibacterium freudenreichii TaxID=1744 RepID=UPI000543480E|nr:hypothetical protein [Propionibacterium freudenreichii]CEG97989.1 Hypothetical protein PFCIRM1025_10460 [Propionibacterium freudenreichii]
MARTPHEHAHAPHEHTHDTHRQARPARRRGKLLRAVLATGLALTMTAALPSVASATPDTPQPQIPASTGPLADCVPLVGDFVKGYGQLPLGLVAPTFGNDGYDALPVASDPSLPRSVDLRDNSQGFNQKVETALRDGQIYVRNIGDKQWREAPMPSCLAGQVVGISLNEDLLIALDSQGWIYTMGNLLSDPSKWGWVRAWGSPFWFGDGLQSPTTEPNRWSLSVIGNQTDRTYTMPDGTQQPISLAKVTQVTALSPDGSKIYTLDPWLAQDYSYEVGTPFNSRFRATSLSSSGSVHFITNEYGDMYTKLSDFDINGSDPAQFRYTWRPDERPSATDALQHLLDPSTAAIQLPTADWAHQPKVPGRITDRISIHSTHAGSENRELRVEGESAAGMHGYWFKALDDPAWQFAPTGEEIQGRWLDNSERDRSTETLVADSPYDYVGTMPTGGELVIDNFAYASARHDAALRVGDKSYPLVLHTVDGRWGTALSMRMGFVGKEGAFGARPAGLVNAVPRNYAAAIEVPYETMLASISDPVLGQFIERDLANQRMHEVFLSVTPNTMKLYDSQHLGGDTTIPNFNKLVTLGEATPEV